MRTARIERNTAETKISLTLTLEGTGKREIQTGCGFLNHMLTLFAAHGGFDLELSCQGDTWVDDHHTVEDVGICLGKAFSQGVGDKRGIARYGSCILPMDEALILTAVDVSGRSCLCNGLTFPTEKIVFGISPFPCTFSSLPGKIPTTLQKEPSSPWPGLFPQL